MHTPYKIKNETSSKISLLSLFFTCIIVLYHSDLRYMYPFMSELTSIAISYFFYISAFFFYKDISNDNYKIRLKKRCFTLLLPYLLWNVIYLLLHIKNYEFTLHNLIYNFTIQPLCTPSWYLPTLFLFFLPAPLFYWCFKRKISTVILFAVSCIIAYLGYLHFQLQLYEIPYIGGYIIRMFQYYLPYLFGAFIGYHFSDKINVTFGKSIIGIASSCIMAILLLYNIPPILRWLFLMLLPVTIWEALPDKLFCSKKLIAYIAMPAFFINMAHCYLHSLWHITPLSGYFTSEKIYMFANIGLTLLTCYLLYYLLHWICPKFLGILTGNRNRK
ncbi:MAG: acyltransferase [Lachnospiraceae bacterium]|nr:acyltransferase [Lachnospiraceae bacterium]